MGLSIEKVCVATVRGRDNDGNTLVKMADIAGELALTKAIKYCLHDPRVKTILLTKADIGKRPPMEDTEPIDADHTGTSDGS